MHPWYSHIRCPKTPNLLPSDQSLGACRRLCSMNPGNECNKRQKNVKPTVCCSKARGWKGQLGQLKKAPTKIHQPSTKRLFCAVFCFFRRFLTSFTDGVPEWPWGQAFSRSSGSRSVGHSPWTLIVEAEFWIFFGPLEPLSNSLSIFRGLQHLHLQSM